MKKENPCLTCSLRGYSPELCTLHRKYLKSERYAKRSLDGGSSRMGGKIGKALAFGACAGLVTSSVGLTAACLIGLKGLCETVLATTVVAGAGMAGAVTNVAVTMRHDEAGPSKTKPKRKVFLPPMYLNGG